MSQPSWSPPSQRDPELWKDGGTLESFRDRFLAAARQIDSTNPGALAAARSALNKVGYTVSATDTGSAVEAPHVPTPVDPGPSTPGPVDPVTSSGTGPLAASAGVGLLGGAVAGALIGKFTHLNIKGHDARGHRHRGRPRRQPRLCDQVAPVP